jgi:hypothetical protein
MWPQKRIPKAAVKAAALQHAIRTTLASPTEMVDQFASVADFAFLKVHLDLTLRFSRAVSALF